MSDLPAGLSAEGRDELAFLAERVARAAGDLVRDERPDGLGVAAVKTSPTDVVTAMDLAAEELIARLLREARPDDALLGEEGGLRAGTSGLTWVVDPIDGTVNYLYRIPTYSVSVAVVAGVPRPPHWLPVAGCVHNPASGQTWTAALGAGARLDGAPLAPLVAPGLSRALVGTGFSYSAARRASQGALVAELLPQVRDIRRAGAASLDLCAVAGGQLDAYYEQGLNAWDVAAGSLVLTEAGGQLRWLGHEAGRDAVLVAAAAPLVEELAGAIADHVARRPGEAPGDLGRR